MSNKFVKVLNCLGVLLGFVSFWFASPEFIGEQRLKKWEHALATGAPHFLKVIFYGLNVCFILMVSFCLAGVFAFWHDVFTVIIILIFCGILGTIYFGCLYSYKRLLKVFSLLANDDKWRQYSLFIGAILFTVSTVLQVIGALFD